MKEIKTKPIPCFKRWSRKGYAVFASLHRYVIIGVLAVSMSILLPPTLCAATFAADSLAVYREVEIEGVGVMGSKQNPTRSLVSQTVVFDRRSEAAAPLQTLESALRLSPSIDVRERGGKGVQADISIRGGSFDQTMVLLNGINFTDARTGHQTHSLPVDMEWVAGVELIDAVPGVGAYAGAVNIRTAPLAERNLRLEATGGAHGYAYGNLSGAVSGRGLTLFGAASYRRSDGYTHNTGFDNANAFVRLNYDSPRAGFFDFQAGWQRRAFGSNGFYSLQYPDQFEQTQTALGSLRWVRGWGPVRLNAAVSYRWNSDRYELIRGEPGRVPYNYHLTDNAGAELWADYASRAGVTSLGGDYTFHHIRSTVLGEPLPRPVGRYDHAKSRHIGNFWLRHGKRWRRFDVSGSVGASTTPYGTSVLWSLAGGYRPVEGLRLEIAAAQSMRLPTFTDLYYTAANYIGNPDLKPERAVTYRFAADYSRERWNVSARLYYRDGHNLIDWVKPSPEADWESCQITSLDTYGAEGRAVYATEGFLRRLVFSYGYLTQSKHSEGISKYALDYMRHKAAVSAEVRFLRRFSFVLTGSVYDRAGSYADREGVMRDYRPYFLLDGRLAWEKGCCRLYVDATNLTDTEYFDFGGLRMPGTWISGGVVLTLGRR